MSESPDIQQQFEAWWNDEGSIGPMPGYDCEEHTRKMCEIAWMNGAYCAQQNLIEEEKKESKKL